MEHLPAIGGIALIWFLVVTIPGPNFIVVTQGSMTRSRKTGILLALGVSTGAGAWASASLLGLSALFKYAGWTYDAIKVVGGCYLVYMGLKTMWHAFIKSKATVGYYDGSVAILFRREINVRRRLTGLRLG